ncbi:hypothetical protein ACJMK2_043584 [Sinanodonta woodiana]|uniref:A disintegrin and metalloproteinase with thrombospondin motifs 7 n=1 Tax=Sinanodonta woodiana TaxID=1069815 RepID=A0ABD3VYQ9_SINWO
MMTELNLNHFFKSMGNSWILLLCFCHLGMTKDEFVFIDRRQEEYVRSLRDYEIIIPSRVTRNGDHAAYHLSPDHSIQKRDVNSFVLDDDDGYLHYKVEVDNKQLLLKVKPNEKLTSPGLIVERKKNMYKNVTDSTFRKFKDVNCHFHGHIINQTYSRVALGLCNGMMGFIHTQNEQYFIEPVKGHDYERNPEHPHIIYRRSAIPSNMDPLQESNVPKASTNEDSCGVKDANDYIAQRERWERHNRKKRSPTGRHKRSVSTERYVETLVVVDPLMVKFYENEDLDTYVLTIMNMVATMFHDASVGNSINIVLVRILIMEEENDDLKITHHADNTLHSFCKFQKKINFKNEDHPNHHDVAVLITRKNICSRVNEPCSTLGLAHVSGMCQPHRTCNINEDTGLALAYTIAHELGHNFGMGHDGQHNDCQDPLGQNIYIMSPNLVADASHKNWSECSRKSITKFIDRDWGYCLDDEPGDHFYDIPVLPPGTMYDADHQCRLQYGPDSSICTGLRDVCSVLWCRVDNKCTTHLEAAAEGTICDQNMWCNMGECVEIGERLEAINGMWGEWSEWSECTRTCDAGVSHSERHCHNPRPSNGGKYCLGERKRYRICNTQDCPEGVPSFQTVQCHEFNYIPYKNGLYEWEHVPTPETPCQLHCKPKNQFFSVMLKDIVTDGSRCTPGTRNMCISGRCRHVGCDFVIDSNAKEDRCGLCHGDGSTCTTIKDQYNETQGLGYVEAIIIPTGARNIRVEEVAAANNFLALRNDKGDYYLNGHWFIQWSGEYEVAGTTLQYVRDSNKETLSAPGPLKEPLHVMLLLQSTNPGVTFEYTVPKENATNTRTQEFKWGYLPWTHCTASCGGGTMRSEAVCTEVESGIVDDVYCNQTAKPDDKQKVCNDHLCPARWWAGPWQHCSVTCGDDGVHHRTVICVRSHGTDEQVALVDAECNALEKPREVEPCQKKDLCPGTGIWVAEEWSSCKSNPCGKQYRTVVCSDNTIGCHKNYKPLEVKECSESCGHWMTEEWQECTRSCGEGIQYRKVTCVSGAICDHTQEPSSEKACNLHSCPVSTELQSYTSTIANNISHTFEKDKDKVQDSFVLEEVSDKESRKENIDGGTGVTRDDSRISVTGGDMPQEDKENNKATAEESNKVPNTIHGTLHKETSKLVLVVTASSVASTSETVNASPKQYEDNSSNKENAESKASTKFEKSSYSSDDKIGKVTMSNTTPPKRRHHHGENTKYPTTQDPFITMVIDNNKSNFNTPKSLHDHKIQTDLEETIKQRMTNKTSSELDMTQIAPENSNIREQNSAHKIDQSEIDIVNNNISNINTDLNGSVDNKEKSLSEMNEPSVDNNSDYEKGNDVVNNTDMRTDSNTNQSNSDSGQDDIVVKLVKETGTLISTDHGQFETKDNSSPGRKPSGDKTEYRSEAGKESVTENKVLNQPKSTAKEDNKETSKKHGNTFYVLETDTSTGFSSVKSEISSINNPLDSDFSSIKKTLDGELLKSLSPIKGEIPKSISDILGKDPPKFDSSINSGIFHLPKDGTESGTFKWLPKEWSECSRRCGGGVRTRPVLCINEATQQPVDRLLCDIHFIPKNIEDCNVAPCGEWVVSEWSQCSATCGTSVQERKVSCPDGKLCDPGGDKPASQRICEVPLCITWISGQWSQCTKTCGGGEQFRLVQCVNLTSQQSAVGCDPKQQLAETQNCNTEACAEEEKEALSITCAHNEMSYEVCRALRRMGQCEKRFVSLKCCKTCGMDKNNLFRPKLQTSR